MAEWLKAAVLKTVELRGSVGSNPTSSAMEMTQVGKPACFFMPTGWLRRIRTDEVSFLTKTAPASAVQLRVIGKNLLLANPNHA